MGVGYDDTCPACRRPTAGSSREGCAGCGAYLHSPCWTAAARCGACGGQETLEAHAARLAIWRRTEQRRLMLGVVAGGLVLLLVVGAVAAVFVIRAYGRSSSQSQDLRETPLGWLLMHPKLVLCLILALCAGILRLIEGVLAIRRRLGLPPPD